MTSALLLAALLATAMGAAEASPAPPRGLADDPALQELIRESLARRPELRQADSLVRAERERVPQAGALQDPMPSLGLQNDGFAGIQVGRMETSFYQVMVTQPLPWPGKLALRSEVASTGVRLAEASVARARLAAEADVRTGSAGSPAPRCWTPSAASSPTRRATCRPWRRPGASPSRRTR